MSDKYSDLGTVPTLRDLSRIYAKRAEVAAGCAESATDPIVRARLSGLADAYRSAASETWLVSIGASPWSAGHSEGSAPMQGAHPVEQGPIDAPPDPTVT